MNVIEDLGLPDLAQDLERLESALHENVVGEDPFLDEVALHLISAGGKRLRPALSLAAARCGLGPTGPTGPDHLPESAILGGVAVELVHLASLYHDDVMDEALTRRNVESVNSRFGNLVAIVAGDFLLARSAEIAAGLGEGVAKLLATTLGKLCAGQVGEVRTAYQTDRTERAYLDAIAGKTAALMASACHIGALVMHLPALESVALQDFGHAFGMAFQVRDDVLDVVGTDRELGKRPGQDLAEGIYTLPVLRALASDTDAAADLAAMLGTPLGSAERERARTLVCATGGIRESIDVARAYVAEARTAAALVGTRDVAAGLDRLAESLAVDLEEAVARVLGQPAGG